MKFGFIAKHRGIWPVSWLCGALDVSRSGFHAWLVRRRGLPKDHGERSVIAGNVLDRQFSAEAPNQKWVADFACIWTAEGSPEACQTRANSHCDCV